MQVINHRLAQDDGTQVAFKPSPNHSGGQIFVPKILVMHYTAGRSADNAANWLCSPKAKASAHLIIGADGKIIQLVPFDVVAWHAGKSEYKGVERVNNFSIGIELDNPGRLARKGHLWRSLSLGQDYPDSAGITLTHKNEHTPSGWHVYPTEQLEVAFEVAHTLVTHYGLKDVVGHEDVAPQRKSDPGPAFPMDSFHSRLFGRADDA